MNEISSAAQAENTAVAERNAPIEPTPATIVIRVAEGGMLCEMLLQKTGEDTLPPRVEDVYAALDENKVVAGINEELIRSACDQPVFYKAYAVARGKEPETGADGALEYLVDTTRELRPKLREDGTADFRDLGFVQNVHAGQILCRIRLPEKGADGHDIYGNVREGRFGADPLNPQGKHTLYSEDKTELIAEVDGTVVVHQGIIDVQDVLRINGNVDNGTGDVEFVGDIVVQGDVVSGFRVSTTGGSITVKGSVEGATITATGDICVQEGINGMNRGKIEAGGNLKCKYIQSSHIKAQGDIYADTIMYCNLECGGNVELNGKRAVLVGGRAAIAGKLVAKTVGTDSHVSTAITMATTGVGFQQELAESERKIKQIEAELNRLLQVMTRFEDLSRKGLATGSQKEAVLQAKDQYLALAETREHTLQHIEEKRRWQLEQSQEKSYIACKGTVHVGTQITFGPLVYRVQTSFASSRVLVEGDEIVTKPM